VRAARGSRYSVKGKKDRVGNHNKGNGSDLLTIKQKKGEEAILPEEPTKTVSVYAIRKKH